MTEAEWTACDDPQKMLLFLRDVPSDRKLRLFISACKLALPPDERRGRPEGGWYEGEPLPSEAGDPGYLRICLQSWTEAFGDDPTRRASLARRAALLRDVVGNPFRAVAFAHGWRTAVVSGMARVAREERALPSGHLDARRLAVLADALEDAGCADADLLSHLRSPGPHVRGCWALDLVLGKQ